MALLTGTGQGAAACTIRFQRREVVAARTSAGRRSSRLNMVGTIWQCVTR